MSWWSLRRSTIRAYSGYTVGSSRKGLSRGILPIITALSTLLALPPLLRSNFANRTGRPFPSDKSLYFFLSPKFRMCGFLEFRYSLLTVNRRWNMKMSTGNSENPICQSSTESCYWLFWFLHNIVLYPLSIIPTERTEYCSCLQMRSAGQYETEAQTEEKQEIRRTCKKLSLFFVPVLIPIK